ncbi:unnamed protein product [Closterium sp. NIES-64]|nr:unnamed protein product [Closterium sp. NIES-64]
MAKLFWDRMKVVAEGVGVGGGAEHEGGGKGGPRVVVEYTYEEEEIEEDTSRKAQHGMQVQEGGAAAQEGGAGVQQQEGGATGQAGGVGGQQQEGVVVAQECRPGQVAANRQLHPELEASQKKLTADVFAKHSEQASVYNKLAADFRTAWNTISEASKSTLKQCDDAVNGVMEERKLLEGARMKLDEMSGKIIDGVATAIAKASEDAVEKQLKLVEEQMVASVVQGIEKAVQEDLFYSAIPPESMKVMKDVVKEGYKEAEAGRLEVLTKAMARGFRGSAGPSTRSRQEEGVAGVRSGGTVRLSEPHSPPLGPAPASKKRQAVTKSSKQAAESGDLVEMGSLLGQAPVQTAFTIVAARHEKAKKPKVLPRH